MQTIKFLAIAIVIALAPTLAAADVVVSHFEPLQQALISKTDQNGQSFSAKSSTPTSVSIRFDALGKSFDLQLVPNDRITSGLQVEVYRGQLANNPQSWARIVLFDGMPRGMIWDGVEMYAVESPDDSTLPIDVPVIYRMADAFIVAGTMSCGSDFLSGSAADIVKDIVTATKVAVARAPGAVSEITMSAIGDFEFTQARGSDLAAEAAIATRLNNVDGFFSDQVGVQINVEYIEPINDPNIPFDDTLVAGTLLGQVSEHRLQTAAHNSRGLTHLYTGKNLETTTVGIAWRGTLCESYFGAGLSEGNGGATTDSLIAAHEIGHNFGAEHDGESETSCEAETGAFIMSPSINGSQQFSACSIAVMQAQAAAAVCTAALPAVDLSVRPVGQLSNVLLGAATDFEYEVSSNGTLDVAGVVVNFSIPNTLTLDTVTTSLGSCSSGAGVVDCDLGILAGLSSQTITLAATPIAIGVGTLSATASTTDTDERLSNNQDSIQLSVDSAVDLVASAPTSAAVFINENTSVSVTLNNISIVDASNVTASITLENGLQANSASWSIGTCNVTAQQVDCQAGTFAAQSTSVLTINATGVSNGRKDVTVVLASTEAEANPDDNSVVGEVRVVTPDKDKDSGGGAINPLLLLLGLVAVLSARRRQVRSWDEAAACTSPAHTTASTRRGKRHVMAANQRISVIAILNRNDIFVDGD